MKWLVGFLCLLLVACDTGGGSDASEEDLTRVLLTAEHLPAGWAIDQEHESDAVDVCNVPLLDDLFDADAEAHRQFTTGETGTFLRQHLVAMEYEDDAMNGMDHLREALSCGGWTEAGTETTWTISETAFTDLGDETAAYSVSTTGGSSTTNGRVIAIRDGGIVLLVVHVTPGEIDLSVTEQLTRKAFDQMQDA